MTSQRSTDFVCIQNTHNNYTKTVLYMTSSGKSLEVSASFTLDIKQLYHVASSKRNRKGEITQLEFLGSNKAKALPLRRLEILYSSCGAGSTCKHCRNILLQHTVNKNTSYPLFQAMQGKEMGNLGFNLGEEMAGELSHRFKNNNNNNNKRFRSAFGKLQELGF